MGEYIDLGNGNKFKLGTCEDLYYARRDQLENLVPRLPELKEYLGTAWRYRFPWPDEDGDMLCPDYRHDRTFRVTVNLPDNCDHDRICCSTGANYNVNLFAPCPNQDNTNFRNIDHSGRYPLYEIAAQKYTEEGDPITILRCGYCKSMFRLQDENAEAVREAIMRYEDRENKDNPLSWWKVVASRIHGEKKAAALA